MLEPKNRLRLLEQFRPPDGFKLDYAIGTTFSLDLHSLLLAPLSMVLFECEEKDEALKDPTAILEALRLLTNKISIFCNRGRIIVPKSDSYLFSFLEPMVIEVLQYIDGDTSNGTWNATWLVAPFGIIDTASL